MTQMLDSAQECAVRREAAKDIIREAGRLALEYFERYTSLTVETKTGQQDVVSVADRAVESMLREAVAARFPNDGLIGEEHGHLAGSSRFSWLIDPIDGTSCFLHGLRSWCVAIAVLEDGAPVLGLVYEPCTGYLYWAERGRGAYRDDASIFVDAMTPFGGGLIAIGASQDASAAHVGSVIAGVLEAGGVYMRNGSAALTLAHVAAGHYLAFYEPKLRAWDCVAGLLLVAEAGGEADDFLAGGGLLEQKPCFAAAPQAAAILRDIAFG
ncbi:inositol monophosphatase family protein [Pelagibacterium xiamenense]|uniref:inositol monophosphatase family protein n=1 Tax=Pelagibacterium xiamenense TaxID=2901140 RepID=UPI001E31D1C3|nr:inositol monophosphatase [Pelagibacterium xiamenense]MCD7060582.1 inositol monophosphatase [Pelagibacterium xiamenense]